MEPVKRSRLVWTTELHQRFEEAVSKAGGIDVAVPKTVLEVWFQRAFSCFSCSPLLVRVSHCQIWCVIVILGMALFANSDLVVG